MMAAKLFGVALAPLFAAIAQVESENGKTSDNVYQLSDAYIEDVRRITDYRGWQYTWADKLDRKKSEHMMATYWLHYGHQYRRKTGKEPTAEVLARIHNGGPNGWRKPATLKYWHRVKAAMDAAEGGARQ